jgi:hypothetical protein
MNLNNQKMNKTFTYLIALLFLMITCLWTNAQNTGTNPYTNSTHVYSSSKSKIPLTTFSWAVSGGGTIQGTTGGLSATIKWGDIPGTYIVSVTESTPALCSTTKSFSVTVVDNPFNMIVSAPGTACAAGSGTVIADGALSPGNTTVVFTVAVAGDMTKTSTFDYDLATISTADITSVTIDHSIYSGTSLNGNNLTIPNSVASFTVSVVIASRFDIVDDLTLTISDGKDFYGTPENDTSDNQGTANVNAVPNTSSIKTD